MDKRYRDLIALEFKECVENTIKRLQNQDTYRPFHQALLSEQALFWSRFERSFSTSFGQRAIEKISKAAVLSNGASAADNQKATILPIPLSYLNAIEDHITHIRNNNKTKSWSEVLADISETPADGLVQQVRVISDLWWFKDGVNNYLSIKTVKPNIDQTAEAKRDLLKIKMVDPTANVYFGLYYNPFGEEREDYSWSPPQNIFNFNEDPCVLIGQEYWDVLGGIGFYAELLNIASEVGEQTRNTISTLR